jgi:formate dehydrogenase major subunit
VLAVRITPGVRPGQLFATFQTPGILVNALTGPNRDSRVGTPEYKVTAVQIESI